jgi:hypothetical protein
LTAIIRKTENEVPTFYHALEKGFGSLRNPLQLFTNRVKIQAVVNSPGPQQGMYMSQKFDTVIEAVHLTQNGMIESVRAYERRGATYSDRVLISRENLLRGIAAGKKFATGRRIENLGSKFEQLLPVRVVEDGGKELVTNDNHLREIDFLTGTPRY